MNRLPHSVQISSFAAAAFHIHDSGLPDTMMPQKPQSTVDDTGLVGYVGPAGVSDRIDSAWRDLCEAEQNGNNHIPKNEVP